MSILRRDCVYIAKGLCLYCEDIFSIFRRDTLHISEGLAPYDNGKDTLSRIRSSPFSCHRSLTTHRDIGHRFITCSSPSLLIKLYHSFIVDSLSITFISFSQIGEKSTNFFLKIGEIRKNSSKIRENSPKMKRDHVIIIKHSHFIQTLSLPHFSFIQNN